MAFTEIDLERQSQDGTLVKAKLKADFLAGGDLNLTDGNNDATITGLKAGVANNDAVNVAQLNAATTGSMSYQGVIDASDNTGAALDGASLGDFFLVSVAGTLDGIAFNVGDHLVVNTDITDFSVDGSGKIDIIDNTESSDILRDSDIVNNLTTSATGSVLDASQGKILKDVQDAQQIEIDAIETGAGLDTDGTYITPSGSNYIDASTSLASADSLLDAAIKVNADAIAALPTDVYGEEPAITVGNPVLGALANAPTADADVRVYINGLRGRVGAGNDYTISGSVITLGFNPKVKDTVVVDYKY
tara:strand:+ start:15595 stop:16506 length:912 start_codon:yes stop_codon:yes gene_type:complete